LGYVLVGTISDANAMIERFGSRVLPESKLIPMNTYEEIGRGWGTK
jgi:hypothetical protein